MKAHMDVIQFESRVEIEAVMSALGDWLDEHADEDDGTVQEMYDKLDVMHMNW